jgi:DNA-binding transcriptional LysR family regulator
MGLMLDWDDFRFFLAIARHRTHSAAAKELGVTQSTVGRRLASLQASLGVRLLQRRDDRYVMTMAGEVVLERLSRVEADLVSIEHAVGGLDVRPAGLVRVASSQLVTSHLLAPCFADLHSRGNAITIETLPLALGEPLASQDADIAVQLRRFEHHDLVVRSLGTVAFGLFGSLAYFKRCGLDAAEDCAGHQLITLLDDRELSQQAGWLSQFGERGTVVARADSYETQHAMTVCGAGLAVLPRFRADAEPSLRRLTTTVPIPDAEIFLAVHQKSRGVSRLRVVLDGIANAIRTKSSILNPG